MMNNPPASASEKAGIFPKVNKQEKHLEKQVQVKEGVKGALYFLNSKGAPNFYFSFVNLVKSSSKMMSNFNPVQSD